MGVIIILVVVHLHAAVVDDHGLELDSGVELCHCTALSQEQTISKLPGAGWGGGV